MYVHRRHKGEGNLNRIEVISTSPTSSSRENTGDSAPGSSLAYGARGTPAMVGVGASDLKRQDSIGVRVLPAPLSQDEMLRSFPKDSAKKKGGGAFAIPVEDIIKVNSSSQLGSFKAARSPLGFAPATSPFGSSGRFSLRELPPLTREVLLAGRAPHHSASLSFCVHFKSCWRCHPPPRRPAQD